MDSRLDFESERVSPVFFGEVDLGSKPGLLIKIERKTRDPPPISGVAGDAGSVCLLHRQQHNPPTMTMVALVLSL